jgi:hypothetical protein
MKPDQMVFPNRRRRVVRSFLCIAALVAVFAVHASSRAVNQATSFELLSAESVQDHGGQILGIPLFLDGALATECRSARGRVTLVFTFSDTVVSGNAILTRGIGRVAGTSFSGNTMTVSLTNVADVQVISVTLSGVTSGGSEVLDDTIVILGMLIGDVDQNATVTSFDTKLTRDSEGQPVSENFRKDVRVDGVIDAADVRIVRRAEGKQLPA